MPRQTALVVEDSPEFTRLATSLLTTEGFRVVHAATGTEGVEAARRHAPELVILDVTLPGLDGIEVCRRIREFSDCYVIMVTARTDELDRVLGLTMGADDYVTKPFSPRELTARIRAMRRRPRATPDSDLRSFGRLTLDPVAREVLVDGEVVDLTRIEYDLLDVLHRLARAAPSCAASSWTPSGAGAGSATTTSSSCTWPTCGASWGRAPPTRATSAPCAASATASNPRRPTRHVPAPA